MKQRGEHIERHIPPGVSVGRTDETTLGNSAVLDGTSCQTSTLRWKAEYQPEYKTTHLESDVCRRQKIEFFSVHNRYQTTDVQREGTRTEESRKPKVAFVIMSTQEV